MTDWQPIPKPAEIAEQRLLEAILEGRFAVDTHLPGERDLAAQLGVTRPTLREALQRLARDGWLDIQHGKPTRVRDYWREGSLAVLATLAGSAVGRAPDFVAHLLEVRALLAPAYTLQACQAAGDEVRAFLENTAGLDDDPSAFARFDWQLHRLLTQRAPNPIFRLLLNSFETLYILMGERYFAFDQCRQHSRAFYAALRDCAPGQAEALARATMQESLSLWVRMTGEKERA
ncbi:MAG: fatty acid metabolism transcriptional regulator FadR [Chloroflexota bacterium]